MKGSIRKNKKILRVLRLMYNICLESRRNETVNRYNPTYIYSWSKYVYSFKTTREQKEQMQIFRDLKELSYISTNRNRMHINPKGRILLAKCKMLK